MKRIVALAALSLVGCSPERVVGNETHVIVSGVWAAKDALRIATVHCEQHLAIPRYRSGDGTTRVYDCV